MSTARRAPNATKCPLDVVWPVEWALCRPSRAGPTAYAGCSGRVWTHRRARGEKVGPALDEPTEALSQACHLGADRHRRRGTVEQRHEGRGVETGAVLRQQRDD